MVLRVRSARCIQLSNGGSCIHSHCARPEHNALIDLQLLCRHRAKGDTNMPATASLLERKGPLSDKTERMVRWVAIVGLLVLRFPLLIVAAMLFPTYKSIAGMIFETGTYFLSAVLIWLERDRLSDFNIDGLALWIIILAKPVEVFLLPRMGFSNTPLAFPHIPALIVLSISAAQFLLFLVYRRTSLKIGRKSVLWYLAGIGIGLLTAAALSYPSSFSVEWPILSHKYALWPFVGMALQGLVYQTGYAAVSEEPLFRAFLWGYLQKSAIGPMWSWLLIALSFSLGHLYYVNSVPISFFVTVPVASLVLGFIAWKSRTIATSLAAHGTVNSVGFPFAVIVAQIRAM